MKVEHVLTNPLLVEHVAPVLAELCARGVTALFVCVPPGRFVHIRRHKLALHQACVAAAQATGLPVSSACDPDANVALTALGANELHLYRGIKLKLRYGVSLHRAAIHHNFAMTHGFDGILAHGDFERDLFSRWIARERIARVGVPRHAAYLARPLTKAEARAQLGLQAQAERKLIAYFPTWSAQSSLRAFAEPLAALAREHCLLIKPHALSLANPEERAALAALERAGACISGSPLTAAAGVFATLTAAADLVVADATSGAATEAALLAPDTPLVLLSLREPVELFREIEQLGPIVQSASALAAEVIEQLSRDRYAHARAQLCARLFYTEHAGARAARLAADAITELARLPKMSSHPGRFERAWPRLARVVRGRATALGVRFAATPPRDLRAGK